MLTNALALQIVWRDHENIAFGESTSRVAVAYVRSLDELCDLGGDARGFFDRVAAVTGVHDRKIDEAAAG